MSAGRRDHVEFVSANPTGPLHVGHGRGPRSGRHRCASSSGPAGPVTREFYVNDAGTDRQDGSVPGRVLQQHGRAIEAATIVDLCARVV